jgi:hypothetical protein
MGEVFAFATMIVAAGVGIAFLDWILRNTADALDEAHGDVPRLPEEVKLGTKNSGAGEGRQVGHRASGTHQNSPRRTLGRGAE